MRDRAWRRWKTEVKTIKRLNYIKRKRWWWRGITDANGFNHVNPILSNFVCTKSHFESKTTATPVWVSKGKCKYSSNKQKPYGRSGMGPFREKDARGLLKILKENGLK